MTLEEAIKHCEENICDNSLCSMEHKQLAEWLKELQELRREQEQKMTNEELVRLANLCYYDFDLSEGEDNCENCPRYYKCREELDELSKEEKK